MNKKALIRIIVFSVLFIWAIIATVFVGIKTHKVNELKKENSLIMEKYDILEVEYEQKMIATQSEIETKDNTITDLNNQITELNKKVNNLNSQITTLKKK